MIKEGITAMKKKEELLKQVEMLNTGIKTFDVPVNHLNETIVELEELEKGIIRLKEQLNYTKRGMGLVKESIEESSNNILKIINGN